MLALFPESGVRKNSIKDKSVLIYITQKRYAIVYRIKNNNLQILRILTRYQDLFAIL